MKKIIVTGATSMIGVATLESALAHGVEVYAIVREGTSRLNRLPQASLLHLVYGSLDKLEDITGLPEDADVLYHFAWIGTSKLDRDNPIIQEVNIKYTLDAVKLAWKCGCKKFVGAGSQAEYGPVDEKINDDTRFKPIISYGSVKFAAGLLSKKLCESYGLIHIWGRIFSVYGRYDNEGTMLNYAIDQFLKKEIAHFSAGTQYWNYLNEHDAGEIFYLLGEQVNKSSEYRIANEQSKPLKEYILEIVQIMDAKNLCEFSVMDENNIKTYGLDTYDEKLFEDIHYTTKHHFREGIYEVIEERKRILKLGM